MSKILNDNTLYLKDIIINSLPEGFSTSHSLDCSNSTLTSLPIGLEVGGDLILTESKITALPARLVVGNNVITDANSIFIPSDALIGGKITTAGGQQIPPFQFKHWIESDDGVGIYYKKTVMVMREDIILDDFYYPEVVFYQNICPTSNIHIVSYTENDKTYKLVCSGIVDAKEVVDWHRASLKGIDKYKDYNIDELRTVDELKEIYFVCTGTCNSGIKDFLEVFHIDETKKYTIRQVREMILRLPFKARSAKNVFIDFFEPKE